MLYLIAKLPFPLIYSLAWLSYLLAYHVLRYRRAITRANLERAFPNLSLEDLKRLERGYYRHLANLSFETIKASNMSEQDFRKRVVFTNSEILQPFADAQKPVMLMTSHHWNWEWLLIAGHIQLPYPLTTVYKPLHNGRMDRFMLDSRQRYGAQMIPNKNAAAEIIKRRRETTAFVLVSDQAPGRSDPHIWTQFLNQPTMFHTGPERIAKIAKLPVFYAHMRRLSTGYYNCTFVPVGKPPYSKDENDLTQAYIQATHDAISDQPEGWLWSHKRWKKTPPAETQQADTELSNKS